MRRPGRVTSWSAVAGAVALAAAAAFLGALGVPRAASSPHGRVETTATSHPIHNFNILYSTSSPLFGVVSTTITTVSLGRSARHLLVTHDFVHYERITPPPLPSENGVVGGFLSASFPTEDDGWLAVANGDGSTGYLYHTTDGGTSWQLIRTLWAGSGGTASVYFSEPTHSWLIGGNPADNTLAVTVTTDGGQTWQPLLNEAGWTSDLGQVMPTFSDPAHGFVANTTTKPVPQTKLSPTEPATLQNLMETSDGGAEWVAAHPPVANPGTVSYGTPAFFGPNGVLPIEATKRGEDNTGPVIVDFDETSDGGTRWSSRSSLQTTATGTLTIVRAESRPSLTISVPTARAWWVLSEAPSRRITLYRTTDGGGRWTHPAAKGLPVSLPAVRSPGTPWTASIHAVSATIAFVTISGSTSLHAGSRSVTTFVTTDGGARWTRFSRVGP